MGFWVFMLVMVLLIPCAFIGFGFLFLKKIPRNINGAFGYRTRRSMQNKETWAFAHRYIGKLWMICGIILLPASCVCMLLVLGKSDELVGTIGAVVEMLEIGLMLITIIPTEQALKKNFDEYGRARSL